ncbi:ribosome modulation factor [Microbulbifer thermotolerans]|uniref:Ribosome modulation factor n=1 Tax=Microbulbifer thermotolerans TaxID=252514 RepID=A0A143HMD1_MICTH|nr:ribosome modulation factor [Microbulbifer thermotolerans]AMX02656.1 ribosome modulation factor [Microbulbifer thermotolerans]MCX2779809.1 ribosome modulation factor [Microbulbifer thermotolerans]MCX2784416.1 ribosome modulation factor [Microbulbifer thermotolerans]MCX2794477.1 ribosome modulation factor [Microbulbifer thermotolerans]MCX2800412.1 ribosome modulation factor [Microbulbifer thermotolerans]
MKRQKRDPSERAFYRGYLAATQNKALANCPYENGNLHQAWVNGWREGREDYWNGFGGSTMAQKLEIYSTVSSEVHHPNGWSST